MGLSLKVAARWPIFCRGQIGLKYVGTSACRFLLRLTTFRLGAESSKSRWPLSGENCNLLCWKRRHIGKDACSRDSHDNSSLARASTNCLGPPHTSWQGPTRRFEIKHCQISPDKHRPWIHRTLANVKIFLSADKNRLACGGLKYADTN